MNIQSTRRKISLALVGLMTTAALGVPGRTEKPEEVKAADLLPPSIVSGTNSQVLDPVADDGYLYTYQLQSKFGVMTVTSTATLYERVHEFNMIAQMDELSGTKEFSKGVEAQAKNVAKGAENLVVHPVKTTKKAISGVGRLFGKIGHAFSGDSDSHTSVANVIGFSKVERAYAQRFQVDPYSRNPYLQKTLKDVSTAGFLGGAITKLGLGAVGGGAGTFLTVSSTTNSLGALVTSKSGKELASYNTDTLRAMGVDEDIIDLFLKNDHFTRTERTSIVVSLDSMKDTKNREAFVKFSILTADDDVAAFRRRQAEMYSAFHNTQKPIKEFLFLDQFAAGVLEDNSLLIIAPVDHLLWTASMANYITSLNHEMSANPRPAKHLWLGGSASPMALKNLKQEGWQVKQNAADLLKSK